jgi:glycosyltransferase involved in cell wall biosynthesis
MEKSIRKKILWNSDFSKLLTGFGRNSKAVLKYLYDTGKYDIVEYACAPFTFNDERLKSVPWKTYGAIPEDPYVWESIQSSDNEKFKFVTRYGSFYIDEIVEKEKPDVFIGVNDFWAFSEMYDKPWWNKIPSALWITIDSLPIYSEAIQNAHKIKNFWVWSKFAENEMNRLGFDHVKTLHGAFDVSDFKPLENKVELKKIHGLEDVFVFGFVFRNQLRKLVGSLIEGFKLYKDKNPNIKAKLLLHTCWSEGWDISAFIEEFKLDKSDVLTTHICRSCKKYSIRPFDGEGVNCYSCGDPKSVVTPSGGLGVTEKEMNEIYNLMDFYIHPITSGGLEMPLVESLLAGTPIATVNYSCGEEFCEQDFVKIINHSEYREIGSNFKKSQPCPNSIKDIMEWAVSADLNDRSKLGREWALKEFDLNLICKRVEDWIDSSPPADHSYSIKSQTYNEDYEPNNQIVDDEEWAMELVKGIFGFEESKHSDTIKKMVNNLEKGSSREELYKRAIEAAQCHNQSKKAGAASNFFKNDDDTNNVCFIAPPSLEDKLNVSTFFKELCLGDHSVYLVGVELDGDLFSQFGKFTLLPKNTNTMKIEFLANIKNQSGKKRFKTIFYKAENEIKTVHSE